MRRDPGVLALSLLSIFFLFVASLADASTIRVPADHPTIQAGLMACQPGDSVLVSAGTYVENITWPSTPSICLKSVSGPQTTILDGSNPSHPDTGSVIVFAAGQDTGTIIEGFTITRGTGTIYPPLNAYQGGGILCVGASPTIQNNVITGNTERAAAGGGILCMNASSPTIRGNTIRGNRAYAVPYGHGGGIFCWVGTSATIVDNVITDNECYAGCGIGLESTSSVVTGNIIADNIGIGDSYGGGMHFVGDTSTVNGNTISRNSATRGGGLRVSASTPTILDNVITGNTATSNGGGMQSAYDSAPTVAGNDISGNTAETGNGGGISYYYDYPADADGEIGARAAMGCVAAPPKTGFELLYGSFTDNDIVGNRGEGILCWGGSPAIERCRILANRGTGIRCEGEAFPEVHDNYIAGHAPAYGMFNTSSWIVVDAENNWWGAPSGPYHPLANPSGLGDPVSDWVDFDPWLVQAAAEMMPATPTGKLQAHTRPNPFNPTTTIEYVLPQAGAVTLRVYDVLGREVATLVDGVQSGGAHAIGWDASGKASGVYYYRLEAGNWSAVRPMVLAR